MQVTLPISQYIVEFKDSMSVKERNALEAIQYEKATIQGAQVSMQASTYTAFAKQAVQTFLVTAKDANGLDIPLMVQYDDLDSRDAELLEEQALLIYGNLKKK